MAQVLEGSGSNTCGECMATRLVKPLASIQHPVTDLISCMVWVEMGRITAPQVSEYLNQWNLISN